MNFTFPEIARSKRGNDDWMQIGKIREELDEACRAKSENYQHFIVEAFDLLHSVETLIRMQDLSDAEIDAYVTIVTEKNARRWYYDDDADKGPKVLDCQLDIDECIEMCGKDG